MDFTTDTTTIEKLRELFTECLTRAAYNQDAELEVKTFNDFLEWGRMIFWEELEDKRELREEFFGEEEDGVFQIIVGEGNIQLSARDKDSEPIIKRMAREIEGLMKEAEIVLVNSPPEKPKAKEATGARAEEVIEYLKVTIAVIKADPKLAEVWEKIIASAQGQK